ncbi:unnamed protein product [Moneuplotes crassus]|uniref:Uncharacterized protein n=2 Tax=Euplotes crassus TaxID=5936 RepID=A0AAD1Y445_EUPCR|nr:unnamed protein product [Moneuplotes crassus]
MKASQSINSLAIKQRKAKESFQDPSTEPNSARVFLTERIPNSRQILGKAISMDRSIMNNGKRLKKYKLSKIMNRVVESKERLLDRGFTSTLLQTEDIHLKRREIEMKQRDTVLIEWAKEKVREVKSGNFIPPAIREVVDKNIKKDLIKAKNKVERVNKKIKREESIGFRRKGQYFQVENQFPTISYDRFNKDDDFGKMIHLGSGISTIKHIRGEFPIKSSWPEGWKFKNYPPGAEYLEEEDETDKKKALPDPVLKVRNFHKKYARISTPPDPSETKKYICSHKLVQKPTSDESPSIHNYIKLEKEKRFDAMKDQAKRRAEVKTINIITEFGEGKIDFKGFKKRGSSINLGVTSSRSSILGSKNDSEKQTHLGDKLKPRRLSTIRDLKKAPKSSMMRSVHSSLAMKNKAKKAPLNSLNKPLLPITDRNEKGNIISPLDSNDLRKSASNFRRRLGVNVKVARKSINLDDENLEKSPKPTLLHGSSSEDILSQLKKIDLEVKKQLEKYHAVQQQESPVVRLPVGSPDIRITGFDKIHSLREESDESLSSQESDSTPFCPTLSNKDDISPGVEHITEYFRANPEVKKEPIGKQAQKITLQFIVSRIESMKYGRKPEDAKDQSRRWRKRIKNLKKTEKFKNNTQNKCERLINNCESLIRNDIPSRVLYRDLQSYLQNSNMEINDKIIRILSLHSENI